MDPKLLAKFFKKECTEEEVKQVLAWFERENINQDDLWLTEWKTTSYEKEFDSANYSRFVLDEIHRSLPLDKPQRNKKESTLKIAAVILIILASSWSVWFLAVNDNSTEELSLTSKSIVTETPPGMKKIFQLKDSSKVYLNSESKITYPEKFDDRKREVQLTGEAYFEVKKNPSSPFMVKTGDLITTALGTAFNISSFDDSNITTVSLTDGKVQIDYKDNPENRLILLPGEQIILDKLKGRITKSTFDKSLVIAWTRNTIVFENDSLEEIIRKLERWYGVTIDIENGNPSSGKDWDYSGEYKEESLRNVLDGISFVKNFTYKMEGKHVKIYLK